ncbi:MAG: hypothetical protein AAFV25_27375 [Bacteroidota bacterium]
MTSKPIPYEFVLDLLHPLEIRVKSMFGVQVLYVNEKLCLGLRKRERVPEDNGLMIRCETDAVAEQLAKEVPSLRAMQSIPSKKWLLIPTEADDFEELAEWVCGLIRRGDQRIGVLG